MPFDSADTKSAPVDNKKQLSKSFSTPAAQNLSATSKVAQRPQLLRSLTRTESIKQSITSGTATFFGIPGSNVGQHQNNMQRWNNRRLRHCTRRYGPLKEVPGEITNEFVDGAHSSAAGTPMEPMAVGKKFGESVESGISTVGRSMSVESRSHRRPTLSRRDSVAKMAWTGLSSFVRSPGRKRQQPGFKRPKQSRSFSPNDIVSVGVSGGEDSVFEEATPSSAPTSPSPGLVSPYPIPADMSVILEQLEETTDGVPLKEVHTAEPAEPRRPSMMKAQKPHLTLKRTVATAPDFCEPSPLQDDVFFDITPTAGAPIAAPALAAPPGVQFALAYDYHDGHVHEVPRGASVPHVHIYQRVPQPHELVLDYPSPITRRNNEARRRFFASPNQIGGGAQAHPAAKRRTVGKWGAAGAEEPKTLSQMWSKFLSKALNNSDRRTYGEGVVGRFFGRTLKKRSELSPKVQEKLDDFDDYRPFFTYWVTIVQVLILIISLASYGFGPFGFGRTELTAMVLHTSLVREQVAYFEKENFWVGPRYADLVHLGAKYAPCMRRDKNIYDVIDKNKRIEKGSACCIRNDRSGCYQTTQDNCPSLLAFWYKYDGTNNPENRTSGSVCNQDPRECLNPLSVEPHKWPDDITQWRICTNVSDNPQEPHTKCELTGRPCCYGIVGECRITTRDYCDFVKGYFHEEATLCSQVSCLGEVCGMVPFVDREYPNQFYRLFTAIFLHAGIIHIGFTVIIQFFLMRDLEKLIGWFRLSIIYLGSGIGGYLASSVFVPYAAEVGPAGSHFGLLAALFVDAIYSWRMIVKPWKALVQLICVLVFLLLLGLLPWVDNYAHAFGFIFGLLLSLALFPYIQFDENDHRKRIVIVVTSLLLCVGLFAVLLMLFYFVPLWECINCVYFNCIPFTEHFCDNEGLRLEPLPY